MHHAETQAQGPSCCAPVSFIADEVGAKAIISKCIQVVDLILRLEDVSAL